MRRPGRDAGGIRIRALDLEVALADGAADQGQAVPAGAERVRKPAGSGPYLAPMIETELLPIAVAEAALPLFWTLLPATVPNEPTL